MSRLPQSVIDKVASISTQADEYAVLASRTVQKINDLHKASSVIDDPDEMRQALHEVERLRGVQGDHQRRSKELAAVATSLNAWLRGQPANVTLELVAAPAINLQKNESLQDALDSVRGHVADLGNERAKVKLARPPISALKQKVVAYVQERAQRGKPNISLTNGLEIDFAAGTFADGTIRRVVDVMCWLHPYQMRKRLEVEVEAASGDGGLVLTADERATRLAEIDAEMVKLERVEEAIVMRLQDAGQVVARRASASPQAILGVKVATEKVKKSRAA